MTHPDLLQEAEKLDAEARTAILCLYIAVEESVAKDVDRKVSAALDALASELRRARAALEDLTEAAAENQAAVDSLKACLRFVYDYDAPILVEIRRIYASRGLTFPDEILGDALRSAEEGKR